ncbi:hypothetical protein ACFOOK_26160 [Micromonospora krabiensis]|uniref:Uncharacterized protein n=1 Tax=Micromonospora krabiensis TaxID=307121 RepID=A0A1C3N5U1_9ACTN|nr:hypothetical protein [Micromonospora krabiensis]SBV27950.1 hypothetical protein GA0070620_3481 [Micromonospora krabiensis]
MSTAPKTKTIVVTFIKKVYADVAVEIPEDFPAEYAVTVATRDIANLSAEEALQQGAVWDESDWQLGSTMYAADRAYNSAAYSVIV